MICGRCEDGGECYFRDGLDVALADVIDAVEAGDTPRGVGLRIETAIAGWHSCASDRRRLAELIERCVQTDCNALGTVLLISWEFGVPLVGRKIEILTKSSPGEPSST